MTEKLKKILIRVAIILAGMILLTWMLIMLLGDAALKKGIETIASRTLGVKVRLEKVHLSILAGKVELKNLTVGNPAGYQHENLLTLGQARVKVKISSLLSDTVEIETLELDGIKLYMEQKGFSSNLQDVINSLPDAKAKPKDPAAEKSQGKNLKIDKLEMSDISVNIKLLPIPGKTDTITLKLAPIEMTDLGKDSKFTVAKLSGKVLVSLAAGVAKQAGDMLPVEMLTSLKDSLAKQGEVLLDAGKKVIDATIKQGENIGRGIIKGGSDVGKGASDAIKGILGGKKEEPDKK